MKKHLLLILSLACILFACKPDPVAPTIATTAVTEITENTAKSGGEVVADGGAEVTCRGVCWSKTQNPTINDNRTDDGSGIGTFISSISDLEDSTTYYVRAYAINSVGIAYGQEVCFMTLDVVDNPEEPGDDGGEEEIFLPEVKTVSITDVDIHTAIVTGEVISDGGTEVTARGVCWSTEQNPTIEDSHSTDSIGEGLFISHLTELNPNTKYYVRVYATNEIGTAYGEEKSFVTLEEIVIELPEVKIVSVADVDTHTAIVTGEVLSDGGENVVVRGVCWSTIHNPTICEYHTNDGEGVGEFTSRLTDLYPNTTYYVRAYAMNKKGVAYSEEISFTTLEEIIIEKPEVKTVSVTDIDIHTAIVTGEVVSDGGAEVVERGFIWNIQGNDNGSIESNRVEVGSGLGVYTYQFTGLQPNTEYYVLAYAINSEGEAIGEHIYFTTMDDEEENTFINGYEYVDLGLPSGVKWAAQNVGATTPSEYGDYFAWGETEPKADYSESNNSTYGVAIDDISGNEQYDAATAHWGATWRMPTREEYTELINNCIWEWTTIDNKVGFKVVGPNGKHIFLPAAGFMFGTTPYFPEQYGYYWTSFPGTDNDFGAFTLYFGIDGYDTAWYFRYAGLPIRPVSN